MKKDKIYKCKDCDKEVRIKSVTPLLADLELCVSCNTERVIDKYEKPECDK